MLKKILRAALAAVIAVVFCAAALAAWLSLTEYRPGGAEAATVSGGAEKSPAPGDTLTLASFNLGYCGLGAKADFFMDGGRAVRTGDKAWVEENLAGVIAALKALDADILLLQEVDKNSRRSFGVDQTARLAAAFPELDGAFALNYSCPFVPFPLPPIGRVESGLMSLSAFDAGSAQRHSLPCPFSWPVRTANLKRCALASYIPLEGGGYLVAVNVHLEAYDSGEGKAAQTGALLELAQAEYEKGNYVVIGGDFNQTFPGSGELFPVKNDKLWTPGVLSPEELPEGWKLVWDEDSPTCRLLNRPYDPDGAETQHYIIDGFVCSPNVEALGAETAELGFEYSDHNPVTLTFRLTP